MVTSFWVYNILKQLGLRIGGIDFTKNDIIISTGDPLLKIIIATMVINSYNSWD